MTAILLIDPLLEYDVSDLFPLMEGKGVGTAKSTNEIRQAIVDAGFDLHKGEWKKTRKNRTTVANRQFKELVDDLQEEFSIYTNVLKGGSVPFSEYSAALKKTLKDAYYKAFSIGVRSSGTAAPGLPISAEDRQYIESAFREESKYLSRMLNDMANGTLKGQTEKRLQAYIDTLKHQYYAGRISGTPTGWVIDWISPLDRNTCVSCRFLSDNSPYTKKTLSTTPRAGQTRCLNQCRCRLVAREVGLKRFIQVENSHRSKRWYTERLRLLKVGT
jgi:hypothetical protein